MKRLIVTADDAGLDPGMTAGAIAAHRDGIVTACSLVANGRAFDDAVARLRETPSLEVGVHLTVVEEQPLTSMRFPGKWPSFVPLYLGGLVKRDLLEAELRAQIEKVLSTGLRVTHLNGHQHLHILFFDLVEALAREYGIGYVRTVNDRGGTAGLARRASIAALNLLGRRAGGTNAYTIGVKNAGNLRDVAALLDHVDDVTELVTHPGLAVRGYSHWRYDWDAETRALCDAGVREELARRGIELTSPSRVSSVYERDI